MSRPSVKEPVVVCSRAAQRLAAIYRQHRPDQPALALVSQLGKAFAENQRGAAEQTSTVRTAVLDAPLSCTSSPWQPQVTDWENLRDTHSELYVTCHKLRRLQLLHGTLVEVCPSQDSSGTVHLARILAIDIEHNTATLQHAQQQNLSSSYMTPPANVSLQPAQKQQRQQQLQQQLLLSDFVAEEAWENDVAYLAPALAYNLRLQHELWPLMPQVSLDADRQSLTGAVPATAHLNHDGKQLHSTGIQLLVRPLRQCPAKKLAEVPQSGCHKAKVPVATKMVIVRIGVPQIALLTVPAAAKGKDEDPALLPQQSHSSDAGAAVQDRMDRTAEAETSGSDLDRTLDEELLVSQLQTYFQESIRLLAKGDVFAIPSASTGDTDSLLRSLYSMPSGPQTVGDLIHFKVTCLEPACGTSCAIDFNQTNLMLEGVCSSPLPVGIAAYTASKLPQPAHPSLSSGHHARSHTSVPNLTGSQTASQGTQAAPGATPESPVAQGRKHNEQVPVHEGRLQQLGVHANAAWGEMPELAGCGPLLPSWRQIADLLVPLFHRDSADLALQVSVLLFGPRGSGRSTAVRAATAALGIHMVPFSCHDLKGQTDSQTATALKASLEAAHEFAPVVLLLRHFEVLSESPQGASQGD